MICIQGKSSIIVLAITDYQLLLFYTRSDQTEDEDPYVTTTKCAAYTIQQPIPLAPCAAYGTLQQSSAPQPTTSIPTTSCVAYGTLQQSSVQQLTADIPTSPCVAYGGIQPATSTL